MNISGTVAVVSGAAVAAVAITVGVLAPKSAHVVAEARPSPSAAPASAASVAETIRMPQEDPVAAKLRAALTLGDAVEVARPFMADGHDKSSLGTFMILAWGNDMLTWEDVAVARDETSYARVEKDSDAERGKRLCVSGPIVEIAKSNVGGLRHFEGLMRSARGDLFHFLALRSTGDILRGSFARFCGVATGMFHYSNSAGGTGHAVEVVGIFDLPENRE